MPHLIFSCLESRVENNGALFGRYLLGPVRIGQAATITTALRRTLLSEVRGIAITAIEIVGAYHQYSSIKGVRESALDIILNLKQVVLSGTTIHNLPAIGYIDIQGPRTVTADDLVLPNGICCVNSNQLIATLSANGLLKIKFVISAGKSRLTPYTDSAHNLSEKVFQPKTRLEEKEELPLYHRKMLRQKGNNISQHKRKDFLLTSKLSQTVWDRENNVILYNKKRRSEINTSHLHAFQKVKEIDATPKKALSCLSVSLKKSPSIFAFSFKNEATPGLVKALKLQEGNLFPLKEKHVSAGRFNRRLSNLELSNSKSVFFDKPVGVFTPHQEMRVGRYHEPPKAPSIDGRLPEGLVTRSVLPVDPLFTPITRVNFAIQIDEQWQEPRERIIIEVWSNGSIHPRQAIHEAATNLVYMFSLLR